VGRDEMYFFLVVKLVMEQTVRVDSISLCCL
jgi:hypothetical protein